MDKFVGTLTKIRLLKEKPLWVRFTLHTNESEINCLSAKDILSKQLMMLPEDRYEVKVTGHFNKKNQLIVREFRVLNKDKFADELGL